MAPARLLAAILLCSLPALAQIQSDAPVAANPNNETSQLSKGAWQRTSAEPWRLTPNAPAKIVSELNPLDRVRVDQFRFDRSRVDSGTPTWTSKDNAVTVTPGSIQQSDANTTCYTMRSYLVARDSKDSDSTHIAGYSTCQPASRYHVKSTAEGPVSLQR